MRIRRATPKDIEGVYHTFLDLINAEDAMAKRISGYPMNVRKRRPDFEKRAKKQLLKSIRQRKSLFIVAEKNNEIVAYAYATIIRYKDLYFYTPPNGYLDAIVVRKKYRRQGIAKALFKEVETWFTKKKCARAMLDTFTNNPAVEVYTKFGYLTYDYRMFKPLP